MSASDDKIYIDERSYFEAFLQFNELRKRERFLDMTIMTDGDKKIEAHRVVVSACFPLLEDKIAQAEGSILRWRRFSLQVVETAIEFAYTGKLKLNLDNVTQLYLLGHNLGCDTMISCCMDYLKSRISANNLIDVWNAANVTANNELLGYCTPIIARNFNSPKISPEFFTFTRVESLKHLLKESTISSLPEEDKLLAISSWINAENSTRERYFKSLIHELDLGRLPSDFIIDILTDKVRICLSKTLIDYLVDSWRERKPSKSVSDQVIVREDVCIYGLKGQNSRPIFMRLPQLSNDFATKFRINCPSDCCVLGLNDVVYFIGGIFTDGFPISTSTQVNPDSGKSAKVSPMNFGRSEHGAATNGEHIFVFGGISGSEKSPTSTCEQYDPSEDR
ncbi:hypothetical protein Aperf_G00000050930 [Anoplocephala perfoliata]